MLVQSKPVELEPAVAHEHLVEELGEEGDLEGALLVVVGPVVEQDAEGHRRAVELPGLGLRVGMHLSRINQYCSNRTAVCPIKIRIPAMLTNPDSGNAYSQNFYGNSDSQKNKNSQNKRAQIDSSPPPRE